MKFTKLRLRGGGWSIDLPVAGADPEDRYILKSADGLDPPDINVFISDSLMNGGIYQGRRPASREVVLLIGLNPRWALGETPSDLRQTIYSMLSQASLSIPDTPYDNGLLLQVIQDDPGIDNDDVVLMQTTCFISKMENNIFSSEPEVQLTLPCLQWFFEAPNAIHMDEQFVPDTLLLTNQGNAETGVRLTLDCVGTGAGSFKYHDNATTSFFEVVYPFAFDDRLVIDSNPGSRGVWVTRTGITTSLMGYVTQGSTWPVLHTAQTFSPFEPASFWVLYDAVYTPKFWGV